MEPHEVVLMLLEVKCSDCSISSNTGEPFPDFPGGLCCDFPSPWQNQSFFSLGGLGLEIVVLPCSLLNGLFSSSYMPCALKHRQSQAFSDLAKVELWAGRVWGTSDCELRLLVPLVTEATGKKHSSLDGSSLPHLWEAAFTTVKHSCNLKPAEQRNWCWRTIVTCATALVLQCHSSSTGAAPCSSEQHCWLGQPAGDTCGCWMSTWHTWVADPPSPWRWGNEGLHCSHRGMRMHSVLPVGTKLQEQECLMGINSLLTWQTECLCLCRLEQMCSLEEDLGKTMGTASRRRLWDVKCFMVCGLRYLSHIAQ